MVDLPHVYTSDIQFQETFSFSADTEFDAQRMGQNNNYLLDSVQPIVNELNSIAATAARFAPFDASGGYGIGDHLIVNVPYQIFMAIIFASPGNTNLNIAQSGQGGGFFNPQTPGPPIPIIVNRAINQARNQIYTSSAGYIKFDIVNGPAWNQIVFHLNGGGGFTIRGVLIHG